MEIQETRRHILDILRENGGCTVERIVEAISKRQQRNITTVTVRHHLERLREEELVAEPEIKRRNTPGRPQYIYRLTERAYELFPNNYAGFADLLLTEIKTRLPQQEVNVILEHMADNMAHQAHIPADTSLEERVESVVEHLNSQGYIAAWEAADNGYIISTTNCPYERIVDHHHEMCTFDLHLMTSMLGVVPRYLGSLRKGESACSYFVPASA